MSVESCVVNSEILIRNAIVKQRDNETWNYGWCTYVLLRSRDDWTTREDGSRLRCKQDIGWNFQLTGMSWEFNLDWNWMEINGHDRIARNSLAVWTLCSLFTGCKHGRRSGVYTGGGWGNERLGVNIWGWTLDVEDWKRQSLRPRRPSCPPPPAGGSTPMAANGQFYCFNSFCMKNAPCK